MRSTFAALRLTRLHVLGVLACTLSLSLVGAGQASASHLQGGFISANVSGDTLSGGITHLELRSCVVGAQIAVPVTFTPPTGAAVSRNVVVTATRCVTGSSTYTGTYSESLTGLFGINATNGAYRVRYTNSARIAGITNLANSQNGTVTFEAQVSRTGTTPAGSPNLGSNIATGVGKGSAYSQNLNASDPDADPITPGPLTYASLVKPGDANAADYSVISVSNTGQVTIPAATTNTWNAGQLFIYKVRVTDGQGDYAERDVLLQVGAANNSPPVISGLNTGTPYPINSGESLTIPFSATDPQSGDIVTLSGAGLPAWASLSTTPGNPASGVLTLNPPASLTTRTYGMNFDAVDNNSTVPLTGSATIQVRVQGVPDTTLGVGSPPALTAQTTGAFSFTSNDPNATFECALDSAADSAYTACVAPKSYSGLADGAHTFRVRAVDVDGRKDTTPATYTWTVDTTAPIASVASGPTTRSSSNTATFALTANESGVTYACSLDGASFAACPSSKSYSGLGDGSHTFRVRATDATGNLGSPSSAYAWTVDTAAPDTTIVTRPAAVSNSPAATFTFTGDDGAGTGVDRLEYELDGGAWTTASSPLTLSGLPDGSHTFRVRSVDLAGNVDPTPSAYTWTVDTADPIVTLGARPDRRTNVTTATVAFSANEPATFEYSLDGGSWVTATSPLSLSGLSEGEHAVRVRAIDTAGNVGPSEETLFEVDTTPPTIPAALTLPVNGSRTNAAVVVGYPTLPAGERAQCSLDGAAWFNCADGYEFTGLPDGLYTIRVRTVDAAGNVSVATATTTFTRDTVAPAAANRDTTLGQTDRAQELAFSGEPGGSFECSLDDGQSYQACTSPFEVSGLPDGAQAVKIRQTDVAGNVGLPARYAWTRDTTAPVQQPAGSPGPRVTEPTFAFSGETGSTFECQLDGGAWITCVSPHLPAGTLTDAEHTFRIRQTDRAGNVSAPATTTWTVDTSAPASPALSLTPADEDQGTRFEFTGESGATFECRLDGGGWVACSSPYEPQGLTEGPHTLDVRQTDLAGNVGPAASRTWTVDRTADDLPAVTSAPAAISSTSRFAFTGTDGSTFECRLDQGDWAACASPYEPTGIADGPHTLDVRQRDRAGNRSGAVTRAWTLDTTAPGLVPVLAGPSGQTVSSDVAFDFTGDAGATVECRIDGGAWTVCADRQSFGGLKLGDHAFEVRQTDAAGNVSPVRIERFTVVAQPQPQPAPRPATQPQRSDAPPRTLTAVLSSTVAVQGNDASVGCRLTGVEIVRCTVRMYADLGDRRVLLGTGTRTTDAATGRIRVKVNLTPMGRRFVDRAGGVRATFEASATPVSGRKLRARATARVLPAATLVIPGNGLFAYDRSVLSAGGRRFLDQVVVGSKGSLKAVRCVGHTDSKGSARYNLRLGQRRARTVCRYLRSHGVRAKSSASSSGETRPRASNATAEGRALNRRVELLLRYR